MTAAVEIRALVAEDEPASRRRLVRLLRQQPRVEVVAECAHGREAIDAAARTEANALFLDIQMPRLGGFDVVRHLRGTDAAVVFVTAYDQFALKAFDVHALDYILKPYDDERVAKGVARVRRQLDAEQLDALRSRLHQLLLEFSGAAAGADGGRWASRGERIALKIDGQLRFVPASTITHIVADSCYVKVHTARGMHLVREPIAELIARLPRQFARVHRSAVINLDEVASVQPLSHGEALMFLSSGSAVKVSRSFRDALARLRTTATRGPS